MVYMMADVMERMNYAALKRVDPYVKDIIDTATHVALYTFNGDFSEWERTDVEGALFVYSRSGEPYHGVLIMNRLNTNNLVEPILQGLEFQLQEPFLLYRNPRSRIYGIWFYEKDECVRIATVLDKLVKEVSNPKKLPMIPSTGNKSTGGMGTGIDIFSMLSKAQEDFDSNKTSIKNKSVDVKSSVSQCQEAPPQSVVDFFAKASGGTSHFAAEKSAQPQALFVNHPARTALLPDGSDGNNLQPLLQRLMSNPAHSVEHIEKQQRSVTPNTEISTVSRNKVKQQISDGIKTVSDGNIKLRPISCSNVSEKPGRLVSDNAQSKNLQEQQHMKNSSAYENGMNILRIASPNSTGSLPPPFFGGTIHTVPVVDCSISDRPLSAPLCSNAETQKVALMPPTMFTSSAAKETANLEFVNNVLPLNSKPEISAPVVNSNNAMLSSDCSIPIKPEPLTKNQLLQAVTYLLKNDPDFVHKLHEAYVKSFSELVH